jgi:hypothetical protein
MDGSPLSSYRPRKEVGGNGGHDDRDYTKA